MAAHAAAAATVTLVTVLLCYSATGARGYNFVTITSLFYVPGATGTRYEDEGMCLERGGYLATEATAVLHEADVQALESEGFATYYAFLGGGIVQPWHMESFERGFCPFSSKDPDIWTDTPYSQTNGDNNNCYWRWSAGRWIAMPSSSGLPYDEDKTGIVFYRGQNALGYDRRVNGFPLFFPFGLPMYHPNVQLGHNLVLYRGGQHTAEAVWGDTYARGGFTYGDNFAGDPELVAATLKDWKLLCQTQGPLRLNYEVPNTSSQLQERWWAIYFAILVVLCLITFLVVALCQEREDMDEPPEDVPEWAEKETAQRTVSHRYVSQRSFRGDFSRSSLSGSSIMSQEDDYEDGERRGR
ncbi:hypothetical protein LSCM1_07411 [Leishmania martiniquensis]|uniref:Uncharacterized protein n=1 Tax=Leishmania martiniquensis TaxID=1580590 RepID=A0A836H606_9TRYP|nr:hypothetical protein LSCM1_07411 [Leishmania martiniquensis]